MYRDVRPEQDAEHGHAVRVLDTRQPSDSAVVQSAVDAVDEISASAVVPASHSEGRHLHRHAERRPRRRLLLAGNVLDALAKTPVLGSLYRFSPRFTVSKRVHAGHVRVRHLLPSHGPSWFHTLRLLRYELPVRVRRKCLG